MTVPPVFCIRVGGSEIFTLLNEQVSPADVRLIFLSRWTAIMRMREISAPRKNWVEASSAE